MHIHVAEIIWCLETLCIVPGVKEKVGKKGESEGSLAEAELNVSQKQLKIPKEVNCLLLSSRRLPLIV